MPKLFACRCANLVHAEILQNYSPWRVLNTRYFVQRLPVIRMSHMLNARENLQSRNKIENEQTRYALEWISKSHLVDVWSPPNPQSHVTENQWEIKSISGIRIIVRQILPCNPSDGLSLTWLKVCQGSTICKGSNFCQSLTKISSFFWNIEPFKNIFPLLIRMSCRYVIWHQSNQNSCKVKEIQRRGSVGKILKYTLRNCRVFQQMHTQAYCKKNSTNPQKIFFATN